MAAVSRSLMCASSIRKLTIYSLHIPKRTMTIKATRLSKPLPKANAKYTPPAHTLDDASSFYSELGIENLVLVQPSIYATDNSCMLDALRKLTPKHGRAVVELDPDTIDSETLEEWHTIGVRGVRVNLVSVGRELSEAELRKELMRYANVVRSYGWVLQVYIPLKLAIPLETIIPDLNIKFCIDHFGSPSLPKPLDPRTTLNPYTLFGFESLIKLLQMGNVWIKLSAPYRLSQDPGLRDIEPLGRELVKQAPNRVVYATDWPHTRFENVDSIPFIEMCYGWCDTSPGLAEKLFRTNAEELWDVLAGP